MPMEMHLVHYKVGRNNPHEHFLILQIVIICDYICIHLTSVYSNLLDSL